MGGHDGVGTALGMDVGVALGCSEVEVVGEEVEEVGLEVGSSGVGANGQTLCCGSFKSDWVKYEKVSYMIDETKKNISSNHIPKWSIQFDHQLQGRGIYHTHYQKV